MSRVDDIKKGMLETLGKGYSEKDLSYITDELIEKHNAEAKEIVRDDVHASVVYYGNHLIVNGNRWTLEYSGTDPCGRGTYWYHNARPADTYAVDGNCSAGYWRYRLNIV